MSTRDSGRVAGAHRPDLDGRTRASFRPEIEIDGTTTRVLVEQTARST